MSSTVGTIFRVIFYFSILVIMWIALAFGINILLTVSNIDLSLQNTLIIFAIILAIRAFYPKNIFK
jgi:uncharacterized membrane-anchored protein